MVDPDRPNPMLNQFINLADCEAAAHRQLPRHVWDYIAGGSGAETSLARNQSAFQELTLRPRYLVDHASRSLTTTVLGSQIDLPVILCPAAFQENVHPDGELATCRGGELAGTLTIVPARGGDRIDELGRALSGPLWLQVYHRNRPFTESLVRRAEDAGYRAICPTIDVPVQNPKERDRRNWFLPPYDRVHYALHDGSFSELWPGGYPFGPDELEWLRSLTPLPIVPKGILTAEDARIALELGADALLVSNHGGRVIDTAPSAIEVLPEVVETVGGRVEIYLDSGIRRGSDVLKALALGARAVGIGRPWYWGLAIGGAEGVRRVLEILRAELDAALALCGQTSVTDLAAGVIAVPLSWGLGRPSTATPPDRSPERAA